MVAIFPLKLCRAILGGLKSQLKKDGVVCNGQVGMHAHDPEGEDDDGYLNMCAAEMYVDVGDGHIMKIDNGEGPFFDDLTKQQLPTELVKLARKKELDYFQMKRVWKRVPHEEAWRVKGRPPITVRWVDVNKGDDENPEIRSRLVARQIRGCNEDPMFAPTPPLEALRTVLSYAATDIDGEAPRCRAAGSPDRMQI
jgi:hypothetical protein